MLGLESARILLLFFAQVQTQLTPCKHKYDNKFNLHAVTQPNVHNCCVLVRS
jgi:hypothetical protein